MASLTIRVRDAAGHLWVYPAEDLSAIPLAEGDKGKAAHPMEIEAVRIVDGHRSVLMDIGSVAVLKGQLRRVAFQLRAMQAAVIMLCIAIAVLALRHG